MLSNAQAETAVAISKMVGEDTSNAFSKVLVRELGGSVSTAQKAAIDAYTKATRSRIECCSIQQGCC